MTETPIPAAAETRRAALDEIARRRTFAIISHPDAGKTTLTEKFLLYGGAIQLAGSVTAKKQQSATASDWMELEKQRGISVSSTVLQFDYAGRTVNLLDTPGHKDFSEDTYRVLTAVDAALMVVDAAKGIETQTRKLFEVCRSRGIPIFTFMNKLDRPSRPPLELIDELESVLGIQAVPLNWPMGSGTDFRGVYDREAKEAHAFERTVHGAYRAAESVSGIEDAFVSKLMAKDAYGHFVEELSLLEEAGARFDREELLAGRQTPVFFGSAMNNFGVRMLLDRFLDLAPAPGSRGCEGEEVAPGDERFSGFIFKIQANMNPKHRDRVAFIRIVSGEFRRDMVVPHPRTGRPVRLANSQRLFARERETVESAWPGDVVGIVGNHDFRIGDSLSEGAFARFDGMPFFPPECFANISSASTATQKRFREGLEQLLQDGVARLFELEDSVIRVPLLGAVGPLQFDVLKYRLESEYGAECRVEPARWNLARWWRSKEEGSPSPVIPSDAARGRDALGRPVLFFGSPWSLSYFEEKNPGLEISSAPFGGNA